MTQPVVVYTNCTPDMFRDRIEPLREPAVLRGLGLGRCVADWNTPEKFADKLQPRSVRAHVTREDNMSFLAKNFQYCDMDIVDLVRRAAKDSPSESSGCAGELYYLRSVTTDARTVQVSRLDADFPELAADFVQPDLFEPARFFSSVLRISSGGVRVWTHYDVMDNVYCQIVGHKTAVLWPPWEADRLYLEGDKSRVLDIEKPGAEFPRFKEATSCTAELEPGDVLFIPAFWFHNMKARDFGIAVNVFWKELPEKFYDPKDYYGNKDLLPGAQALRMLDNVIKQLDQLPPVYRDFYTRRLTAKLDRKGLLPGLSSS